LGHRRLECECQYSSSPLAAAGRAQSHGPIKSSSTQCPDESPKAEERYARQSITPGNRIAGVTRPNAASQTTGPFERCAPIAAEVDPAMMYLHHGGETGIYTWLVPFNWWVIKCPGTIDGAICLERGSGKLRCGVASLP